MVVMLFLFTLLIFPIKIGAKLYFLPEEGFLSVKFFLYRFFVFNLEFFSSEGKIFLKIGKRQPSEFVFDFSNTGNNIDFYNPLQITRFSMILHIGGNPQTVTVFSFLSKTIADLLPKSIKSTKIKIRSIPAYYKSGFSAKAKISVFTNLLALLYSLIYYLIKKIFSKKEKTNAIQQSN